ncbi:MAG: STAS domain-containing protein [Planctomycetota bacterium]|jgi:anti-anti-sigma factor
MDVRIERRDAPGDLTVLTISGVFDADTLPHISKVVDELIAAGRTRLVFNFKDLRYFNTASMAWIIQFHKKLTGCGGALAVSEPSKPFESLNSLVGFDRIFSVCPNDEEALAQIS